MTSVRNTTWAWMSPLLWRKRLGGNFMLNSLTYIKEISFLIKNLWTKRFPKITVIFAINLVQEPYPNYSGHVTKIAFYNYLIALNLQSFLGSKLFLTLDIKLIFVNLKILKVIILKWFCIYISNICNPMLKLKLCSF